MRSVLSFFVAFKINGESSILLDHLVTFLEDHATAALPYYALIVVAAGAVYPFASRTWRNSPVSIVFSVFKVIGLLVGVLLVFDVGPQFLFEEDIGPFLLNDLVISVGLLVPIGAVFLALLVGYGFLEFVGVLFAGAAHHLRGHSRECPYLTAEVDPGHVPSSGRTRTGKHRAWTTGRPCVAGSAHDRGRSSRAGGECVDESAGRVADGHGDPAVESCRSDYSDSC